jgi:hypothetical protein
MSDAILNPTHVSINDHVLVSTEAAEYALVLFIGGQLVTHGSEGAGAETVRQLATQLASLYGQNVVDLSFEAAQVGYEFDDIYNDQDVLFSTLTKWLTSLRTGEEEPRVTFVEVISLNDADKSQAAFLNGQLVVFDRDRRNPDFTASEVANRMATALGVGLESVECPIEHIAMPQNGDYEVTDLVQWVQINYFPELLEEESAQPE